MEDLANWMFARYCVAQARSAVGFKLSYTEFCKMEIRLILFQEIDLEISLNNPPNGLCTKP